METETEQIFKEQLRKLPTEIVDFISSTNWDEDLDEIGSLYNLSKEELSGFTREATLVVMGLVHPDEFYDSLKKEVGLQGPVLEALVANVERKVFAPIRPALVEYIEKEANQPELQALKTESETQRHKATPALGSTQTKDWSKMPDVAPDNLPTGEEESFLPNIAPKTGAPAGEPAHPFEEKMKRVFTAGQQSLGDLAIETTPPTPSPPLVGNDPLSNIPPVPQTDPYREPIE